MTQPDSAAIRTDQVAEALTKIEAELTAGAQNLWRDAPTYLAALVEVGKAAANVRRQYEIDAIGLRWDIAKANDDLFAALDALTKAVQ